MASARPVASSPLTGGRSQLLVPGIRVEWATVPPHRGERQRLLGIFIDERGGHAEGTDDADRSTPAEALLSPRQRTIAKLAATGETASEIGASLGISPETVRWTLREIDRRLGIHSRAQLVTLVHVG